MGACEWSCFALLVRSICTLFFSILVLQLCVYKCQNSVLYYELYIRGDVVQCPAGIRNVSLLHSVQGGRDSEVVDSLMAGRSGVLACVRARFSEPIQTRPKPTQPHGKWLPPVFSGLKRLRRGAYHIPASGVGIEYGQNSAFISFHSVGAWSVMELLYLVTTAFKPTQRPTQPSFEWVQDFLSPGAKRSGSEADHLLRLMLRLRMRLVRHTSPPPHPSTFMARKETRLPVSCLSAYEQVDEHTAHKNSKIYHKTYVNKTLNCKT